MRRAGSASVWRGPRTVREPPTLATGSLWAISHNTLLVG